MGARHALLCSLGVVLVALIAAPSAFADDPADGLGVGGPRADRPRATLRVGVSEAPPFVVSDGVNGYDGLAIQLWTKVAARNQWTFELVPVPYASLINGVEDGTIDIGLGAITVTARREGRVDFTHPFHTTGYGIVVHPSEVPPIVMAGRWLMTMGFIKLILGMVTVLFGVGVTVWLFERKANPAHFGGTTRRGLGEAMWWAAVTMTTVGYGDRVPQTIGGRLFGLVWMFASIVLVSTFTAGMASGLSTHAREALVQGESDLGKARIGAIEGTTGWTWLAEHGVRPINFATERAALDALLVDAVDAVFHDAPLVQYRLRDGTYSSLKLLPKLVSRQEYAVVLPLGSPLRKPINQSLLEEITTPSWVRALTVWTGDH